MFGTPVRIHPSVMPGMPHFSPKGALPKGLPPSSDFSVSSANGTPATSGAKGVAVDEEAHRQAREARPAALSHAEEAKREAARAAAAHAST